MHLAPPQPSPAAGRWTLLALFLLSVVLVAAPSAHAHKPSDSYLTFSGDGEHLSARWDIAIKDLAFALDLDENHDGDVTWGELEAAQDAVTAYALGRLDVTTQGQPVVLRPQAIQVADHSDGAYAVLHLHTDTPADAAPIDLDYRLFFDLDPTHRGLVVDRRGASPRTDILSPDGPTLTLDAANTSAWSALWTFIRSGVWHIWIGFDHILFLITLLIPAVWLRRDRQWEPVESVGPAVGSVLRVVTAFTLAHSVTLWLAVMDYVTLPSRLIESVIAFSIILTAVHHLYPLVRMPSWAIAFAFGLVHGFGFANVLLDVGLSRGALAVSLLGFNVGVELGQLAIVAVFLPVALWLRHTNVYRYGVFYAGSVLIAIIAALWMTERVFNLELIPI